MYFDTHCHLCDPAFTEDLDVVLSRAREAGVLRILVPGTDVQDSELAAELSGRVKGVYAAAGMHPSEAEGAGPDELARIGRLLLEPGVIAVGESGLDLHWEDGPPLETQVVLLEKHVSMADTLGLTLVLHSRDAEAELLDVIDGPRTSPTVLHSYTGPAETAIRATEMGFYIGLSGPLTYPANTSLRNLASRLPRDRVLVETDGPYLAPQAQRGRRNEPAFVEHTAATLASTWGTDIESAAGQLLSNSLEAFGLAPHRRTDLVYAMYGRIYMNITGLCDNRCSFCVRERTDGLAGYHLSHGGEEGREPDGGRLRSIVSMLRTEWSDELVFCGYGEPTMRPMLLRELACSASVRGFSTRLNTNGLCLGRLTRAETIAMLEPFDTVSVSLNAHSSGSYADICRPSASGAWELLLEFIRLAKTICRVRTTAVDHPGIDIPSISALAGELGVPFRTRGL